ncbi:MAG: hypothetical protein ACYTXC_15960 [Nostoc sp.]
MLVARHRLPFSQRERLTPREKTRFPRRYRGEEKILSVNVTPDLTAGVF